MIPLHRLNPGATYDRAKALSMVSAFNSAELADDTNYVDGEYRGYVYAIEDQGEFARIRVSDQDGEFVGYY